MNLTATIMLLPLSWVNDCLIYSYYFHPTEDFMNTFPSLNFIKVIKAFLLLLLLVIISIIVYLQHPKFAEPTIEQASYGGKYYHGKFHNPVEHPLVTTKESRLTRLYNFIFNPSPVTVPSRQLPSQKTDLNQLSLNDNVIIWMGHSSYFIQIDGIKILVDPVFSENASPVPMTNVAFEGSNIYKVSDIPDIDYLLITHDHWDHLDYPTISALKDKIAKVIIPIGVGSYFTQWGYDPKNIIEGDWNSKHHFDGIDIYVLPAEHFSGRMLTRNQTLWGSFAVITPQHKIYLSGDSGYGPHFKEIGQQLGVFDIAILENGQYNKNWPYIHMMPDETAQAAIDLKAKALLPAHNSKFKLSNHKWFEPMESLYLLSKNQPYRLLTPIIGASIDLDNQEQIFQPWWQKEEPW